MLNLKKLIKLFFVEKKEIEIYNEFSFQHELGIFLREKLDKKYKVQFERNVSYFKVEAKTIKKEIDISIFNEDKSEKYAIELKFPRNGQHPEQMFSFIKDIQFVEELKLFGEFKQTAYVVLVEDDNFYRRKSKNDGIYAFFREGKLLQGEIQKPTGDGKDGALVQLKNAYQIEWQSLENNRMFYIVKI